MRDSVHLDLRFLTWLIAGILRAVGGISVTTLAERWS